MCHRPPPLQQAAAPRQSPISAAALLLARPPPSISSQAAVYIIERIAASDELLLELVEFVEVANSDGETNVDSLFATRSHCARVRRGPTMYGCAQTRRVLLREIKVIELTIVLNCGYFLLAY